MGEWLTTATNPRHPGTGHDAGRRGWKLHYLPNVKPDAKLKDLRFTVALCGLRPRHGWDLDLFIEDKCERCIGKLSAPYNE